MPCLTSVSKTLNQRDHEASEIVRLKPLFYCVVDSGTHTLSAHRHTCVHVLSVLTCYLHMCVCEQIACEGR